MPGSLTDSELAVRWSCGLLGGRACHLPEGQLYPQMKTPTTPLSSAKHLRNPGTGQSTWPGNGQWSPVQVPCLLLPARSGHHQQVLVTEQRTRTQCSCPRPSLGHGHTLHWEQWRLLSQWLGTDSGVSVTVPPHPDSGWGVERQRDSDEKWDSHPHR